MIIISSLQENKMINKWILSIATLLSVATLPLFSEVIRTNSIQEILPAIEGNNPADTLVLFNIAEVLLDAEIELGTSPWRKLVRTKAPSAHDALTLLTAKKVPHRAVEANTPKLIQSLQEKGYPVMALTSRGRAEWYSTQIEGVDILTEKLLQKIGIDFTKSKLPNALSHLEETDYAPYYHAGILYACHHEKGEILTNIFKDVGYLPGKVVFVDDKRDSLENVDAAMTQLGIPFVGFWYTRTAQDHRDFSPMVAHVQLAKLILENKIMSNEEAKKLVEENYQNIDPNDYFQELLQSVDLSKELVI